MEQKKLKRQLKELLTSGWTEFERKTQWKSYLEEEVKPYYPEVYEVLNGKKL